MRTVNVSGSTAMSGVAAFSGMSALPTPRVDRIAANRRRTSTCSGRRAASASSVTKYTEVAAAAAGAAPNIGRESSGCGVGMEALASPIRPQAIIPPLRTTCGRTPKNAGSHSTRSASLPTSTDPTSASSPCAIAGQIVYFAT